MNIQYGNHPCNLIAIHLDVNLKPPVFPNLKNMICAFTGQEITEGVLKFDKKLEGERKKSKGLIGGNFTEHSYLRYPSDYVSLDVAKCMSPFQGQSNKSLRNFRFIANKEGIQFLERGDVIEVLLCPPEPPFVMCVSFNILPKKHLSYKATINHSSNAFFVETNKGKIAIDRDVIAPIIEVIQKWYSEIPDKPQKTFFTKDEILGNKEPSWEKVKAYGWPSYTKETKIFNQYRGTLLFEFLVTFIQRQKNHKNEFSKQS